MLGPFPAALVCRDEMTWVCSAHPCRTPRLARIVVGTGRRAIRRDVDGDSRHPRRNKNCVVGYSSVNQEQTVAAVMDEAVVALIGRWQEAVFVPEQGAPGTVIWRLCMPLKDWLGNGIVTRDRANIRIQRTSNLRNARFTGPNRPWYEY